MSNTKSKSTQLYGVVYQKLQTKLFRLKKYAELRLSSYLSARISVDGWTFSSADIANQTGLNRNKVYQLCKGLIEAGIFRVKEEQRGCATIYNFDKPALLEYLQGDKAIDDLMNETRQSEEHQPASSASTVTCQSQEQEPDNCGSTSCQWDDQVPARSAGTINKIDNEEREEYLHTNRAYVSISLSQDAETKADEFITNAKLLQASEPELGITITSTARDLLIELFTDKPSLSVKELGNQWYNVLQSALYCKIVVKIEDPLNYAGTKMERGEYDPYFWAKKSRDLSFFIKNRCNVLSSQN